VKFYLSYYTRNKNRPDRKNVFFRNRQANYRIMICKALRHSMNVMNVCQECVQQQMHKYFEVMSVNVMRSGCSWSLSNLNVFSNKLWEYRLGFSRNWGYRTSKGY